MESTRHLMCSPDHFTVAYVINPWMEGNVHDTVSCVAMQQWSALRTIVSQFTEVALLPRCPDFQTSSSLRMPPYCEDVQPS